jgi:hypothetical protein
MNIKKELFAYLLILLMLAVCVIPTYAGSERRVGTSGATELTIPVGSRGSALSGSVNAVASGVEAIYWNPAGLAKSKGVEAMFSSLAYIADIRLNYFAVTSNFGDVGTVGLSLRTLDFGDIQETTELLPEGTGGTFSPNYITIGLSYSRSFTDRIFGGFSAKIINEKILQTSASGIAFDFGVQYVSSMGIKLGVTLKNLGPNMTFDGPDLESFANISGQEAGARQRALRLPGASFELPSTLEIGVGYDYRADDDNLVTVTGTFQNTNFGNDEFRAGVEYSYRDMFFVRAGGMRTQNNEDNIYGPTFGAGVSMPIEGATIMFDYAYRQAEFFDANQWFTLKVGL